MKKLFCILFLILVLILPIFAEAQYFMEQFSACFNVDLSTTKYIHHYDNAIWGSGSANDGATDYGMYHDNQIICVIGVEGSKDKTPVTFTFTGQDWYYILNGTDTRYKRPFGIDLVVRAAFEGKGSDHKTITSIQHLGRQVNAPSNGEITASVTLPATDGSEYYNGNKIISAWLDVILVLDPFVNKDTGLITQNGSDITNNDDRFYGYLISSDSVYTSSFTVNVGGGGNYTYNLQGYYINNPLGSSNTSGFTSSITVAPNANANSFEIKGLKPSNDSESNYTVIGNYYYTTNSKRNGNKNAKAYFFVSSSPDGSKSLDPFLLKYVSPISGQPVSSENKYNSVTYEVGLKSITADKEIRWFGGTDNYSTIRSTLTKALQAETSIEKGSNTSNDLVRVHDDGEILLRIKGNVEDLSAGRYRSNIYFHVVTDF